MPIVAGILFMGILIWVGLHPVQSLFHIAQKRMASQYNPAANSNLGREQVMPESIGIMGPIRVKQEKLQKLGYWVELLLGLVYC